MDLTLTLSVTALIVGSLGMLFGILGFSLGLAAKMSTHRIQYVDPFQENKTVEQHREEWATTSDQLAEINKDISETEQLFDEDNLMELV